MAKDKPQTVAPSQNKTVSMKKAENGYVVSCYNEKMGRDHVMIAKDVTEAKKYASDMLGG